MIIFSSDNQFFKAGDHTFLKEVFHPKNTGRELPYSLAHAYLEVGEQSLPHTLAQSELYYFLNGEGIISIENSQVEITKGDCVLVEANQKQYVKNTGHSRLEFLCIVSPPWSEEGETVGC